MTDDPDPTPGPRRPDRAADPHTVPRIRPRARDGTGFRPLARAADVLARIRREQEGPPAIVHPAPHVGNGLDTRPPPSAEPVAAAVPGPAPRRPEPPPPVAEGDKEDADLDKGEDKEEDADPGKGEDKEEERTGGEVEGEEEDEPKARMTAAGLMYGGAIICPWFEFVGKGKTAGGRGSSVVIRFRDEDRPGEFVRVVIPYKKLLAKPAVLAGFLDDHGLSVRPSKPAQAVLHDYVSDYRVERRITVVERCGWHRGVGFAPSFVLPDGRVIGDRAALVLREPNPHPDWTGQGTLDEWKENVARYARGNSRLLLAVSIAFAGPLLWLLGEASGMFNLVGREQTGKTTSQFLCASVWARGARDANVRSWDTTANAVEATIHQTSDMALVLDDMTKARGADVYEIVYKIGNDISKARRTGSGGNQPTLTWRAIGLSSSERSTVAKIAESRRPLTGGALARQADVPALPGGDARGVFEDCHGLDPAELANHLRRMCGEHHGVAGPAFVGRLVEEVSTPEDQAALLDRIAGIRRRFEERHLPEAAPEAVVTVVRRFSLVAAAATLATEWGIVPWGEGEAEAAIGVCSEAWRRARETAGLSHDVQALRQVSGFLLAHGDARSSETTDRESPKTRQHDRRRVPGRIGWWVMRPDGREWWITAQQWRDVVCHGIDPEATAHLLAEMDLLIRPTARHELQHATYLKGHGPARVYKLRPRITLAGG